MFHFSQPRLHSTQSPWNTTLLTLASAILKIQTLKLSQHYLVLWWNKGLLISPAIHVISWPFGDSQMVSSCKPGELQIPRFFCLFHLIGSSGSGYPSWQVEVVSEHKAHKAHCALYTVHRKIHSSRPFRLLSSPSSLLLLQWQLPCDQGSVLTILVWPTLHFHGYSAVFGLNVILAKLGWWG